MQHVSIHRRMPGVLHIAAVCLILAAASSAPAADDAKAFLDTMNDASPEVRWSVWPQADKYGPTVIVPLGDRYEAGDRAMRQDIKRALTEITHQAANPRTDAKTRKAVADELTKLLAKDKPNSIQYEVLDLIGYVGSDEQVDAVLALTSDDDAQVAEEAMRVLDRIPAKSATAALTSLLKPDAGEAKQVRVLQSLGHRGDPSGAAAVQAFFKQASGKAKVEALNALSHMGWVDDGSVIGLGKEVDAEVLGVIHLRLAANAQKAGKAKEAAAQYVDLSKPGVGEQVQTSAIQALSEIGTPDAIKAIIAAAGDPESDVQVQVQRTLVAWNKGDIQKDLDGAYKSASGAVKAGLLGVLAERSPDNAGALIDAAIKDSAPEVRAKAYALAGQSGDLKHVETLAAAATKESDAGAKYAAQAGSVALGVAAAQAGDSAKAQSIFKNALAYDADDVRWDALVGISTAPSAELAKDVKPFLATEGLAEAAAQATIAIAKSLGESGNSKRQIKLLWRVVDTPGIGGQRNAALNELNALGEDISKIPQREGFLNTWYLIGTFPNTDNSAFGTAYFPEEKVDLAATTDQDGKQLSWKKVATGEVPAIFNLRDQFEEGSNVAIYAYSEVEATEDTPVTLMFGTNDGCVLWLNGEKVFEHEGGRGLQVDGDKVAATLKKGKNTLLLKVLQQGGGWDMAFRLGDAQGAPLDLTKEGSTLSGLSN